MPILNESTSLVIYDDNGVSNAPLHRFIDWRKSILNVIVNKPLNRQYTIPSNSIQSIFNGVRTTSIDGTTAFDIILNPINNSTYRIVHVSGTAPLFRTDRLLTLSGSTITVAVNNNATVTFTISVGSFSAVQIGDIVFIPTTLTGDSISPFNILNGGYWVVLARTTTVLTLSRLSGQGFSGVAEAIVLTSNAQLQAFSSSGIQIGDTLEISSGFSVITQKSFIISSVTASRVEFVSTESLPLESGILPGVSGMIFYNDAKRFVRIEVDQEAVVRFNGDISNNVRLSPRVASDKDGIAFLEKWGVTWSLEVVNRSRSNTMVVTVISAE